MATKVFVLQHVHPLSEGGEDVKFIGVYSTEAAGREAIDALSTQPGFSDFPGGFNLSSYELDVTHWAEGFLTIPPGDDGSEGMP